MTRYVPCALAFLAGLGAGWLAFGRPGAPTEYPARVEILPPTVPGQSAPAVERLEVYGALDGGESIALRPVAPGPRSWKITIVSDRRLVLYAQPVADATP